MRPEDAVAPRFVAWPGLALLYCNKAGSQSAKSLGGQRPSVDPPTKESFHQEMEKYRIRALFLRNPVNRIVSAYTYAVTLQQRWIHDNVLCPLSTPMRKYLGQRTNFPFEEFVFTAVEQFPTDKHIAPQSGTHYGVENFVWPLEDSARGWGKLRDIVPDLPPALPTINRSDPTPVVITPDAEQLIRDFYAEDIEWYIDVCSQAKFCAPRSAASYLQSPSPVQSCGVR